MTTAQVRRRTVARAGAVVVALAAVALLLPAARASVRDDGTWTVAWARSQQITVAQAVELANGNRGPLPLVDQTVRVLARVTGTGSDARITLGNRYGATPLAAGTLLPLSIEAATVARRTSGASIASRTLRDVTFNGARKVIIPAGATVTSDPVALPVTAGEDLAVSLHVALAAVPPAHSSSQVRSYAAAPLSGDHTRDLRGAGFTSVTSSTPILTGIDVRSKTLVGAIAATGGSVTDGTGSDVDAHNDFPSALATRIQRELPAGQQRTVVNGGIGGTTAAAACGAIVLGPSVQERVEADSLSLPGVTHLIVYAGTNDLALGCTAAQIIASYRDIVRQAGRHGIKVLISTVTPRSVYDAAQNAERAKVNAWVRAGGNCSGGCFRSLDFDAVVRDPGQRNRLAPALDSGDAVHPNGKGYALIAASIPLDAFSSS